MPVSNERLDLPVVSQTGNSVFWVAVKGLRLSYHNGYTTGIYSN